MLLGRRRRFAGPSLAAAALTCVLALLSSTSHAQSTSDDLVQRHFDSGIAYLEVSDYDHALEAFQKAYDLSKRPEILLNIAAVNERQGDLAAAVTALKGYLDGSLEGEHVETVKLSIQNLEKRSQELESAKVVPSAPAPTAAPPGSAEPPAPPVPATSPPARAERRPLPAFISLGVGGVLAGASLATGLIAKAKYDDAESSCGRSCRDSQLSGSRTFALTSTILTAGAVLGVGLGVALLLVAGGDDQLGSNAPHFDVALGSSTAAASAAWSF